MPATEFGYLNGKAELLYPLTSLKHLWVCKAFICDLVKEHFFFYGAPDSLILPASNLVLHSGLHLSALPLGSPGTWPCVLCSTDSNPDLMPR